MHLEQGPQQPLGMPLQQQQQHQHQQPHQNQQQQPSQPPPLPQLSIFKGGGFVAADLHFMLRRAGVVPAITLQVGAGCASSFEAGGAVPTWLWGECLVLFAVRFGSCRGSCGAVRFAVVSTECMWKIVPAVYSAPKPRVK